MACNNNNTTNKNSSSSSSSNSQTMEEYLKKKSQIEDQTDYQFVQRIVQELTQSCALPLPVPAQAIPPLILQAAQYFWENYDGASEERWYCVKNKDISRYGPNNLIKLPPQILSVCGVYKTTDTFNYGVLGDFSLERIILNNSALASGIGGSMTNVFGDGQTGYGLTDVVAGLYEVSTFKSVFDTPLTYDYNAYSNYLEIMGALGYSDLILDVYKRVKIQDLYKLYYFFRYCVCLGLRSMGTILGTFSYKLPGGIELNYSRFDDQASNEMYKIDEWIQQQHSPYYFINSNTI